MRQILSKAAGGLRVREIIEGLPETGYTSRSKHLKKRVGAMLYKWDEFTRVSRGRYALRG